MVANEHNIPVPALPAPPLPAVPPPPPQCHYFYNARCTKRHDNAFVQALYYQAMKGHRQLSRTPNMHSLNHARRVVNACFNFNFKYIVFKRRLERLRLRFTTFKSILEAPGVVWDRHQNVVLFEEDRWNELVEGNAFVNAYRFAEEPDWNELSAIFSTDEPKEGPNDPIDISSDEAESGGEIAEGTDESTISD
ncbi:hypothetical protein Salat_1224800 [Sesamum alatum]|uniref:Myb/SANT-like domain-containing protein n=1 Tax=Sesamum alatum TaxID=300844 RepID=A0AAE2CP10_9LAMI|nr:hypothetical protein Salat_1224800 [Sesamum alatum]